MNGSKFHQFSPILTRSFHLDIFQPEQEAAFQVLLFGGSGITEAEYLSRAQLLNPVFYKPLAELEQEPGMPPFNFTFITAPYDINIRHLEVNDDQQERWAAHVYDEILPNLPDLPTYWIGYSGGFALAWLSLQQVSRCFGGAALGGDQISVDFTRPSWWQEELRLLYNRHDPVYQVNRMAIAELVDSREAICYRSLTGSHALADYIANESFGGLIRRVAFRATTF